MSFQGFPPGSVSAALPLETMAAVLPAQLVFLPVHPDALPPSQPAGPLDLCSQLCDVAESQKTFYICHLSIPTSYQGEQLQKMESLNHYNTGARVKWISSGISMR